MVYVYEKRVVYALYWVIIILTDVEIHVIASWWYSIRVGSVGGSALGFESKALM